MVPTLFQLPLSSKFTLQIVMYITATRPFMYTKSSHARAQNYHSFIDIIHSSTCIKHSRMLSMYWKCIYSCFPDPLPPLYICMCVCMYIHVCILSCSYMDGGSTCVVYMYVKIPSIHLHVSSISRCYACMSLQCIYVYMLLIFPIQPSHHIHFPSPTVTL